MFHILVYGDSDFVGYLDVDGVVVNFWQKLSNLYTFSRMLEKLIFYSNFYLHVFHLQTSD